MVTTPGAIVSEMANALSLDRMFDAFAHPTRRAILERLAGGELTVGEASAGLGVAKPTISRHLRVLEAAGALERVVDGRTHRLRLAEAPLVEAEAWVAAQVRRPRGLPQAGATMTTVRLEWTFEASAEAVFETWTNPEVLRRWWAPGANWTTPTAEVDLRVGGGYRLTTRDPDLVACTIVGEYLSISRPERLVYSRRWETREEGDSLVDVRFVERDGRTTVLLEHTGLANTQARIEQERGWRARLDNLDARVFAGLDRRAA